MVARLLKKARKSKYDRLLSKCWGIKAVFHSVNFRPWRFFCWSFKKSCFGNIETTLGKTCENVKLTLKSHLLLIDVFLGISRLFSGFVPGIYLLWWWYLFALLLLIYFNKLQEEGEGGCLRHRVHTQLSLSYFFL